MRKLLGVEHDQRVQEVGLGCIGGEGAIADGRGRGLGPAVPLQPQPHDRRRHERDPAQHHRRARPRPPPRPLTGARVGRARERHDLAREDEVEVARAQLARFASQTAASRAQPRRQGPSPVSGLPPPTSRDLFKRFFRGTSAMEKAIPGSGLGLAISQVIAEAHGTTIEVESTAGAGSTSSLAFPAA